jgi:hypothetical protein
MMLFTVLQMLLTTIFIKRNYRLYSKYVLDRFIQGCDKINHYALPINITESKLPIQLIKVLEQWFCGSQSYMLSGPSVFRISSQLQLVADRQRGVLCLLFCSPYTLITYITHG